VIGLTLAPPFTVAPPGSLCRSPRRGRRHPGGCRDPWPLPTPPPPVHNGSPPALTLVAHSHRSGPPGQFSVTAPPIPFLSTPLPAPGGEVGDGLRYPPVKMPCPEIFQKIIPGIIPLGDGTRRQHFIYGRLAGPYCRRFKHFTAPPGSSPWTPLLRAVVELRVALSAVDSSCRGEVLGRISGCRCPGGAGWPEEGRRHPEPISFCLLLPVSAVFARVPIYER